MPPIYPLASGQRSHATAGNCQHNKRGEAPAVIGRAGPPRTSQDEQRRNDREEKKDVIEIQTGSKN